MTPAVAIVDARNLFHQSESVLGFGVYPSVDGVIRGLELYGFDVREVHVGVALARDQDREALSYSHAINAAYVEQVESHPQGRVLRGELHLKDSGAEEKMVDVACAVDICRSVTRIQGGGSPYQSIVVLSQDIDLKPAYEYAAELDVSVHIAACSTVQRRAEPYLLLTEVPLALMCRESLALDSELDMSVVGHELRARLAHLLHDQSGQEHSWRSIRRERRRGGVLLQHESGVLGVAEEGTIGGFTRGKTVRLYADGVDFGIGDSQFPIARCVPAPGLS